MFLKIKVFKILIFRKHPSSTYGDALKKYSVCLPNTNYVSKKKFLRLVTLVNYTRPYATHSLPALITLNLLCMLKILGSRSVLLF